MPELFKAFAATVLKPSKFKFENLCFLVPRLRFDVKNIMLRCLCSPDNRESECNFISHSDVDLRIMVDHRSRLENKRYLICSFGFNPSPATPSRFLRARIRRCQCKHSFATVQSFAIPVHQRQMHIHTHGERRPKKHDSRTLCMNRTPDLNGRQHLRSTTLALDLIYPFSRVFRCQTQLRLHCLFHTQWKMPEFHTNRFVGFQFDKTMTARCVVF
mmetsp:Transcript_17299/g.31043  ORF Transcript_17299/g.31043 Transcript_17299/m.31043 type:complete len:215 (-) Transcript_17299:102-746(-)